MSQKLSASEGLVHVVIANRLLLYRPIQIYPYMEGATIGPSNAINQSIDGANRSTNQCQHSITTLTFEFSEKAT